MARLNYNTRLVTLGEDDEAIKPRLRAKVLVTRNGKDFHRDIKKYRYGLLWITNRGDHRTLAVRIKNVLMKANFNGNLMQVVKV